MFNLRLAMIRPRKSITHTVPATICVDPSVLLLMFLLALCAPALAQSAPVHITGEVHRGEKFERDITHGLVLRLAPYDGGWDIEVGPANTTDDYTDCVNVPLHGVTSRQIQGWHFRTDDNTAARPPNDFLTPGIGGKREFEFVLTAADQSKSCANVDDIEHTPNQTDAQRNAATSRFGALARGSATFTITAMTLGNLQPGQQAWIDSLKFEAAFTFAKPDNPSHQKNP
jgi:hypothetical protein